LYVDAFVFFSATQDEEDLFQKVLSSNLKVYFMGEVDYFLGTAFTWKHLLEGHIFVHLSQTAFT